VTDAAHAAPLRPVWRSLGPLVMALADIRADMATNLQRFRHLFRRNELAPDIVEDGNDYLDVMDP